VPGNRKTALRTTYNDKTHLTPGGKTLIYNRCRSNYNAWRSTHLLAPSLSVSEAELLYRKRTKAATSRVQVQ